MHFTTADYQRTTVPLDYGNYIHWLHFGRSTKENVIVPIGNSISYLIGDTGNRSGIIEILESNLWPPKKIFTIKT